MVNTQYSPRAERKLSARLYSGVIELGGEQKIYISVSGSSGPAKVGVIAGGHKEEWDINGDFQTIFSFKPSELGEDEAVVYTSEGETASLEYSVTSQMKVFMDKISVPAFIKVGETKNVSAYLVNNGINEESVHMNINVNGADKLANFMLNKKYFVSLPVSFQKAGVQTIRFEASIAGINISETRMIEAYEEPAIYYDTDYADGKAILKLDVRNSRVKNVTITIGSEEKKLDEAFGTKSVYFTLAQGQYAMEIVCYDVAGKQYRTPATIEFREKNFFEKLLEMISDIASSASSLFGKLFQPG
jgi:hypothetical protein